MEKESESEGVRSNIPDDNTKRHLTVSDINQDVKKLKHVFVAGDVYTILVSGKDTNGAYCLIDMLVPPGGVGPSPSGSSAPILEVLVGNIREIPEAWPTA